MMWARGRVACSDSLRATADAVRRPADVSGRAERVNLGFRARGSANFEEGVYIWR